jgi:hypothetical protein
MLFGNTDQMHSFAGRQRMNRRLRIVTASEILAEPARRVRRQLFVLNGLRQNDAQCACDTAHRIQGKSFNPERRDQAPTIGAIDRTDRPVAERRQNVPFQGPGASDRSPPRRTASTRPRVRPAVPLCRPPLLSRVDKTHALTLVLESSRETKGSPPPALALVFGRWRTDARSDSHADGGGSHGY